MLFLNILVVNIKNKPVMCEYGGDFPNTECVPNVEIDKFPCECDVIIYQSFKIDNLSAIVTETGMFVVKI